VTTDFRSSALGEEPGDKAILILRTRPARRRLASRGVLTYWTLQRAAKSRSPPTPCAATTADRAAVLDETPRPQVFARDRARRPAFDALLRRAGIRYEDI
jgi:hypothetical protein